MSSLDIGSLIQQAAILKSHSQKPFRRRFDASPPWLQQSLYATDEIVRLRNSEESGAILEFAAENKESGNNKFKEGLFQEAVNDYIKVMSVLRWMQNEDPDWQQKDIDDEYIINRAFVSYNEAEIEQAKDIEVLVLLNLARCYQKLSDWASAIRACDCALDLRPTCAKAFYLRAKARETPVCNEASDLELALLDFKQAADIEPDNKVIEPDILKVSYFSHNFILS